MYVLYPEFLIKKEQPKFWNFSLKRKSSFFFSICKSYNNLQIKYSSDKMLF